MGSMHALTLDLMVELLMAYIMLHCDMHLSEMDDSTDSSGKGQNILAGKRGISGESHGMGGRPWSPSGS